MGMSGEGIVSTYDEEVLAGLDFVSESASEDTIVLGGASTAVMSRRQEEAVEDQQLQATGAPAIVRGTTFQSSYAK